MIRLSLFNFNPLKLLVMTKDEFLKALNNGKTVHAVTKDKKSVWYISPSPSYGAYVSLYIKISGEDSYFQSLCNTIHRLSAYDIVKTLDIDWKIFDD